MPSRRYAFYYMMGEPGTIYSWYIEPIVGKLIYPGAEQPYSVVELSHPVRQVLKDLFDREFLRCQSTGTS